LRSVGLKLVVVVTIVTARLCAAQLPTELEDCAGPSADFCSDSTAVLMEDDCGETFYRHRGEIAWAALKNVGPVTISVKTLDRRFYMTFPLYVMVRGRTNPTDGTDCRTGMGGHVALVALGGQQCGGAWEPVGPIDPARYGVPPGANYSLQCVFFEPLPGTIFPGLEPSTVGFSCIRVTSHPLQTGDASWAHVKTLFR